MKSYIQGFITGSVLIFGFMVLTASNSDAYYDTDDIMTKLDDIQYNLSDTESKLNYIESNVDDIKSDVRHIKSFGVDCN